MILGDRTCPRQSCRAAPCCETWSREKTVKGNKGVDGGKEENRVFAFGKINLKFHQTKTPSELRRIAPKRHENSDLSERFRVNFHQCRPAHTIGRPTPSLSRHSGTTIRGHVGTTHKAARSRHCSLCAAIGSGKQPNFDAEAPKGSWGSMARRPNLRDRC